MQLIMIADVEDKKYQITIDLTREQFDAMDAAGGSKENNILWAMFRNLHQHVRVEHYGEDFNTVMGIPPDVKMKDFTVLSDPERSST